jgi:hypothetical protein
MHKDLSDGYRDDIEQAARELAQRMFEQGESLAIAREAMINAFDRAAEELDA